MGFVDLNKQSSGSERRVLVLEAIVIYTTGE